MFFELVVEQAPVDAQTLGGAGPIPSGPGQRFPNHPTLEPGYRLVPPGFEQGFGKLR